MTSCRCFFCGYGLGKVIKDNRTYWDDALSRVPRRGVFLWPFEIYRDGYQGGVLNISPAAGALTGTGEFSLVMGVAIVEREFCAGLDRVECVKFCSFSENSHEGIWCARVVDEPESCRLFCGINGFPVIDFDDGNPLLCFGPPTPFSLRNAFSFVLADFLPCSQRDFGE